MPPNPYRLISDMDSKLCMLRDLQIQGSPRYGLPMVTASKIASLLEVLLDGIRQFENAGTSFTSIEP